MLFYTAAVGLEGTGFPLTTGGNDDEEAGGNDGEGGGVPTPDRGPHATHPNAFFSVPCGAW